MPITGNFNGLALLHANLAKLSRVPSIASKEAAKGISLELAREFAVGVDPYGSSWAKTKRGGKPLVRTGALRASAKASAMSGAGIQLGPLVGYGVFHQTGTKHMPARPILPYGGLPARWNAIITKAVKDAIGAQWGG